MTEFIMKELDNGKIKSVYKRFIKPVFKEKKNGDDFLLPEDCIEGLIAKDRYCGFGVYEGKKLICFGLFIGNIKRRVLLLDYFLVLKKYKGFNYPDIFFEMLKEILKSESADVSFPFGVFIELEGVTGLSDEEVLKREEKLSFFRRAGAYITDILPAVRDKEYNVLFLPVNARLSRAELKTELLKIYGEVLPSFKDKKKYITRLTEEIDGLR